MFRSHKLSAKLVGIHALALVVALASIGLTLLVSWHLEGGAAAINDAGSLRMRTYRLAYLAGQDGGGPPAASTRDLVSREIRAFDEVVAALSRGDPTRPLFMPVTPAVTTAFAALERAWSDLRPALQAASIPGAPRVDQGALTAFVAIVDDLVAAVEQDINRTLALLRGIQLALLALAIAGAVALVYLAYVFIIRPLTALHDGLQRMARGEFSARVPVDSADEFGALAAGFNHMAESLEASYHHLEARVAEKTSTLAEQNARLSTLYDLTAFLNAPGSQEDLARGFLSRVLVATGAQAGAVRLVGRDGTLHLFVEEGVPAALAGKEACLAPGECACGVSAVKHQSIVHVLDGKRLPLIITLPHCIDAGFKTVSAYPVAAQKQVLGVFTLLYREARETTGAERHMLESLGQHLGVAIESVRLASADRELAIAGERNLLAQELHDSIAQSLAFLNLQLQMLHQSMARERHGEAREVIAEIEAGVKECNADVRELLVHFRTRVGTGDLEHAIGAQLAKFQRQTGVATRFSATGAALALPADDQLQVLHILHEALSNVRKHAGAQSVAVTMARGPSYHFTVRDDGCGFESREAPGDDDHVGLRIMQERALRIGGTLAVRSRPGEGTTVVLDVPLLRAEGELPATPAAGPARRRAAPSLEVVA